MDEAAKPASREERAIKVAIATSILGSITKLTAGLVTGSMSMITSAIDSLGDLFVSIVNLFVVRIADSAPDDDHNYGHAKAEGLGAMFEGGFIFAAGVFIIYESIHKIRIGDHSRNSTLGIIVMLPILAITTATVLYLRRVAKETGSLIVKSDALHYATDVYVNIGVLVSLVLVKLTNKPIIDSVISIVIALYMLYSSTHIVRAGIDVVMDRSLDAETCGKLKALLSSTTGIESFHDFRTRAGRIPHVDFHVIVKPEVTTKEVHDLFLELQTKIRAIVGPSTKVLMHADPLGG
ncbi:MAG: cation diffusion facilitator family transporter [Polyangiales bacterium]